MSPEAFIKLFGPEAQMEQQAHFAVQKVSALPGLIAARDLHPFAQTARLESFFINVRLMADFLVRTTDQRDFGAATLVPDWVPMPRDGLSPPDAPRPRLPLALCNQRWVALFAG